MENTKKLTASLTQEQWSIVSEALSNMPYGRVVSLIIELQKQFSEQMEKAE